jgi:hypothetical protein
MMMMVMIMDFLSTTRHWLPIISADLFFRAYAIMEQEGQATST